MTARPGAAPSGGRRRSRRRPEGSRRPLLVLLLPARLEALAARERAEDLLGAPGAVAVEPAALGYGATARLPRLLRERIAASQARRMALPGEPRAVMVFDARQYPLARALLAEHDAAELWYGGEGGGELHEAAAARAALRFAPAPAPGTAVRKIDHELWERMEALGIESGRLGSERLRPEP